MIKLPLYKQVKNKLIKKINTSMKEGDILPTESKMEEVYQVSRITIRKAIDELVNEGYVEKFQGKGTFVRSTKIVQEVNSITSWTEEMLDKGKNPKSKGTKIYEVKPSRKMMRKLNLQLNEDIVCVERIRLIDDEPILLMFNYIRKKYILGFLEKGLSRESLYEQLEEEYDIILAEAKEQIKARLVTDLEARALGISSEDAVLHITRTTYLPNDVPFEMVEMITRSDKYEYHLTISGRVKQKL